MSWFLLFRRDQGVPLAELQGWLRKRLNCTDDGVLSFLTDCAEEDAQVCLCVCVCVCI